MTSAGSASPVSINIFLMTYFLLTQSCLRIHPGLSLGTSSESVQTYVHTNYFLCIAFKKTSNMWISMQAEPLLGNTSSSRACLMLCRQFAPKASLLIQYKDDVIGTHKPLSSWRSGIRGCYGRSGGWCCTRSSWSRALAGGSPRIWQGWGILCSSLRVGLSRIWLHCWKRRHSIRIFTNITI